MKTKVTLAWLESINACKDGIEYFKTLNISNVYEVIDRCMGDDQFGYANWLIVRFMNKKQGQRYAVYAAESVLHIYEDRHPDDNRPRLAIASAKDVIKRDSKKNRDAAWSAASAANAAANDDDADYSAYATATAARSASAAARAATNFHASNAARAASDAAWAASDAGYRGHMAKILRYGVDIIKS